MRQLLEREVSTVHLDGLRKVDRKGINNEISEAPSSRAIRLDLLTRLTGKAHSTISMRYPSAYWDSADFCQH